MEFSKAPGGYSIDEVRAFLAELAASLDRVAPGHLSPRDMEDEVESILDAARADAEAEIDAAKKKADQITLRALAEAAHGKKDARAEASAVRMRARRRAELTVDEAIQHDWSGGAALHVVLDVFEKRLSRLHQATGDASWIQTELDEMSSTIRSVIQRTGLDARPQQGIRVLIVCTTDRCRSPAAAAILSRMLEKLGGNHVSIDSRGTDAGAGWGPSLDVSKCLERQSIDITEHRSRPLRARDVALADVVVVMERRHADRVHKLFPWANVILLGQLREIPKIRPEADARERLSLLLEGAERREGVEIRRPGRGRRSYKRCIDEMTRHLRVLASTLAGSADLGPIRRRRVGRGMK